MAGTSSYADKVQHGHISESEKAYLLRALSDDFSRLGGKAGEGKTVLRSATKLSLGKAVFGLHKAMACGIYLYFMGKPPTEEEFKRWFSELYGNKVALQKYHFAGKGFFQAIVESEVQRELVLSTVAAFKGSLVFTFPWTPAMQPEDMLLHHCPVWVEFPNLPYYLWDQVREVASALGKVLFAPKEGQQESKQAKKACVLWDRRQPTPDVLQFDMEGHLLHVAVQFQTFPDSCYKCKQTGHFARDCPGPQNPSPKSESAQAKAQSSVDSKVPQNVESDTAGQSKQLVVYEKEKMQNSESAEGKHTPKEEGWKTAQNKKTLAKQGCPAPSKPLQDIHNKPKSKGNPKKEARKKDKPFSSILEDKENLFSKVGSDNV